MGLIKRNFIRHLTMSVVQKHGSITLGLYCCSVWASYRKGDIEALEKVQKKSNEEFASIEAPSV